MIDRLKFGFPKFNLIFYISDTFDLVLCNVYILTIV